MHFLDKRIEVICKELKKLSVVQSKKMDKWYYKKGNYLRPKDAEESVSEWLNFDSKTMHWYGPDEHYWFKTCLQIPEEFHNKPIYLNVRTQIDEWDDAKNPQFLLFVNGDIVQGIDMNHRTVKICDSGYTGQELNIELQAYTGILHTEFNLLTEIQEISAEIEALYYDLQVPLWAFPRIKDEKLIKELEIILNNTINLLDLRSPYSQNFYISIDKAKDYIRKALYENMSGYQEIIASCIGHTHIDVAWWWTVEQTREKVARSFATVLKLMEEYPDYKFMSSQPQLYVFLKKRYPELYEKVKERIQEGRWEVEGGMWVEADCNLSSGESLVRQFLHGKKFFKEEFGKDNEVLWLPDVFGYSGALPQIMKKSGIKYFMTTKLAWNQFNKIPNDTFLWKGIDGSKILTHFITTLGVGQPIKDFFTTYNGTLHPDSIMGGWERYQNKEINHDILISYGYGDGGGGPTKEMLETSLRMEKGIKGIPKVRQEFAGVYFRELEKRVEHNPRLNTWEGELYFEYHRGTLTSMARNKRDNRLSELRLMDLELLSVLALENGFVYPETELHELWENVLLNQFHDILPGSSIREVYEVTKEEYEIILAKIKILLEERMNSLLDSSEKITIFNTTGFNRSDNIQINLSENKALIDENGSIYPAQTTNNIAVVYVQDLPSKGFKTFEVIDYNNEQSFFDVESHKIETPFYKIHFNDFGQMTSFYDKEFERELLIEKEVGNAFIVYEDKPIYYDNWDIDIFYTEKQYPVNQLVSMKWVEVGSIMAVLELQYLYSNSSITQKIKFYSQSRRVDFETYVNWKESQHLLKVHFPFDIHTDEATFDIQFGNVTRKTHKNTSWDIARFESCGHKWVDISEGNYGVSVLNNCKYGHSVQNGKVGISLIKSGIEPNPTTDQEEHFFSYAILPHAGDFRRGKVVQEAYKFNQPAYARYGTPQQSEFSFVKAEKENIVIETIKRAEGNGIIIRLYESERSKTKTKIVFHKALAKVMECDLMENNIKEVKCVENSIEIEFKPFEIVTLKVIFDAN